MKKEICIRRRSLEFSASEVFRTCCLHGFVGDQKLVFSFIKTTKRNRPLVAIFFSDVTRDASLGWIEGHHRIAAVPRSEVVFSQVSATFRNLGQLFVGRRAR